MNDSDSLLRIQVGYLNLQTKEWCPGYSHPNIGDRSIDRSWVMFHVKAATQEEAQLQARAYCESKKAKFAGMFVELRDGEARLLNGDIISI